MTYSAFKLTTSPQRHSTEFSKRRLVSAIHSNWTKKPPCDFLSRNFLNWWKGLLRPILLQSTAQAHLEARLAFLLQRFCKGSFVLDPGSWLAYRWLHIGGIEDSVYFKMNTFAKKIHRLQKMLMDFQGIRENKRGFSFLTFFRLRRAKN